MGKGKRKVIRRARKERRGPDDSGSDSEAESLGGSAMSRTESEVSILSDQSVDDTDLVLEELRRLGEKLTDKDSQTRIDGAKGIRKVLGRTYIGDLLMVSKDVTDTVVDGLQAMLSKPNKTVSSEERTNALQCVSQLALTFGASDQGDHVCSKFINLSMDLVESSTVTQESRAEAMLTWGLLTALYGSPLDTRVIESLKDLYGTFRKENAVQEAVINSLALLGAFLESESLLDISTELIKFSLSALTSEDYGIRKAAGILLALCYECLYHDLHGEKEVVKYEEGEDGTVRILVDESVVSILKDLSTDRRRYRAKKERRDQRRVFRDILSTVEGGEAPDATFHVKGCEVRVDTWSTCICLDAFSGYLGDGWNTHVIMNPFIQEVFGIDSSMFRKKGTKKGNRISGKSSKHLDTRSGVFL
eukprot:TRINITY_DN3622_c0_g1_i1.p1 TRINITY_DN3622_c0_g1~~TRINITY_DN3622_c0_g1_i1.p1  ORF type:complete len:418 (-),score=94.21 TRINITY_DN3622_c0_g1_i1:150-1403(-)